MLLSFLIKKSVFMCWYVCVSSSSLLSPSLFFSSPSFLHILVPNPPFILPLLFLPFCQIPLKKKPLHTLAELFLGTVMMSSLSRSVLCNFKKKKKKKNIHKSMHKTQMSWALFRSTFAPPSGSTISLSSPAAIYSETLRTRSAFLPRREAPRQASHLFSSGTVSIPGSRPCKEAPGTSASQSSYTLTARSAILTTKFRKRNPKEEQGHLSPQTACWRKTIRSALGNTN